MSERESLCECRQALQEICDERDASSGLSRERYARWAAAFEGLIWPLDDGEPTDVEAWGEVDRG